MRRTSTLTMTIRLQSTLVVAIVIALATLLVPTPVDAYSSGAPNNRKVCTGMIPGHGTKQNTATGSSPYQLIVTDVDGQVSINLVATSQVTFAGFIIQARETDDREKIVDGEFLESDEGQARDCLNGRKNTLTHTSGETKTQVTTIWLPPAKYNGSAIFRATVVQVKQAYYDQIYSRPVYFRSGQQIDEKTYLGDADKRPMMSDQPSHSSPAPAAATGGIDYDLCRENVCIGLGDSGCLSSRTCMALLAGKKVNADTTEYSIFARPAANNDYRSKYWSMGLSDDKFMGDDFVIDCLADSSGRIRLAYSFNNGRSNKPVTLPTLVASNVRTAYRNGLVVCQWEMPTRFTTLGKTYDLDTGRYHHFFAYGELESDSGEKSYHELKTRSNEPVDLAQVGSITEKDLSYLIKVHGCCMVLAWMGTVSLGIIFARYFKDAWEHSLWCGVKIWFACHRTLMVLGLTLMIIAQVCIFVYVGGYHLGLHQIVGSIAFTFALLQPIGAFFRPHPDAPGRWLFNWGHWLGGNIGHITALAAILFATRLATARLSESFLYTVIGWILFHVVVHLIFQFHNSCIGTKRTRDIALQDMVNQDPRMFIDKEPSGRSNGAGLLRCFLLFAYIIVSFGLAFLCVLLIARPGEFDFV